MIRSDNGLEIKINELVIFLKEHGMVQQFSINKVERKHIDILNNARALKLQTSFPIKFWV